jgi:hypothetical protein
MPRIKGSCELPQQTIDTIRKMRSRDATLQEIADAVDMTRHAVAHFVKRHGHTYGIEVAVKARRNGGFDKEWHGVIPLGHWSITKPWGKKCDVKPVTKS